MTAVLANVIGGRASNPMANDMLKSIDDFGDQLRRSSRKQVRALANSDYQTSEDRASGDPARIARAEQTTRPATQTLS